MSFRFLRAKSKHDQQNPGIVGSQRNNGASKPMSLRLLVVAIGMIAVGAMMTIAHAQTPEPMTELSRKAGTLTTNMSRSEVIETLGTPPTWIFLPGDPSEFAPKQGMLVTLIWKNGLCSPVIADFDAAQKLIGWDEGRGSCATTETETTAFLPPAGKYGCADTHRSIYCRGAE